MFTANGVFVLFNILILWGNKIKTIIKNVCLILIERVVMFNWVM